MNLFRSRKVKRVGQLAAGLVVALSASFALNGCSAAEKDDDALTIVATTGYLADAAKELVPDANIVTLVGPGGDPHTYELTTRDVEAMQSADLTVWNGLHLEAHMVEQLEGLGDRQFSADTVLAEENLLAWDDEDDPSATFDPHVWNSPENWQQVVSGMSEKLATIAPDQADSIRDNAKRYNDEIAAADQKISAMMDTIPEHQRLLVTGHDAFQYFGESYDLEVRATDLVSTEAELSAAEINELATMLAKRRVPTIFQDNQKNPQAIASLKESVHAKGWDVTVSDAELYADSLGADEDVDTYLEVLRHNATVVVEGLGGKVSSQTEKP